MTSRHHHPRDVDPRSAQPPLWPVALATLWLFPSASGPVEGTGQIVIVLAPFFVYFGYLLLAFHRNPPGFVSEFFFSVSFAGMFAFVLLMLNNPYRGIFSGVPAENTLLLLTQMVVVVGSCLGWHLVLRKNIGAIYAIPSACLLYFVLMFVVWLIQNP